MYRVRRRPKLDLNAHNPLLFLQQNVSCGYLLELPQQGKKNHQLSPGALDKISILVNNFLISSQKQFLSTV